jgi:hypothetical protein
VSSQKAIALALACPSFQNARGPRRSVELIQIKGTGHKTGLLFWCHQSGDTIMKKLNLLAVSVGAALVCTAVPSSFNWSPANGALFSLDTAEARVGRPLTPVSVAGVNRRVDRRVYRRAAAGAAVGAAAVGAAAVGAAAVGGAAGAAYVGGPAPAYGPGPAVAASSPYGEPGYGYGPGPYPDSVIVNPVTGRWCRTEATGYQWCWTP